LVCFVYMLAGAHSECTLIATFRVAVVLVCDMWQLTRKNLPPSPSLGTKAEWSIYLL